MTSGANVPHADLKLSIRELARPDLALVGHLVAASFERRLRPFMVATQHGWVEFVGVALDHPRRVPTQHLLVAELDGYVVGFADFRTPGDGSGFLSYICVAPAAQGRGIASDLLRECVRRAGDLSSIALDVFENNPPARRMYDRLGFALRETSVWWRSALPIPSTADEVILSDLPLALAAHQRYGFCEVSGTLSGRAIHFGRIGPSVLRLFSGADFDDVELASSLADVFPSLTEAFAVLPDSHQPTTAGAVAFNRVLRMTSLDVPRLLGAP